MTRPVVLIGGGVVVAAYSAAVGWPVLGIVLGAILITLGLSMVGR